MIPRAQDETRDIAREPSILKLPGEGRVGRPPAEKARKSLSWRDEKPDRREQSGLTEVHYAEELYCAGVGKSRRGPAVTSRPRDADRSRALRPRSSATQARARCTPPGASTWLSQRFHLSRHAGVAGPRRVIENACRQALVRRDDRGDASSANLRTPQVATAAAPVRRPDV